MMQVVPSLAAKEKARRGWGSRYDSERDNFDKDVRRSRLLEGLPHVLGIMVKI